MSLLRLMRAITPVDLSILTNKCDRDGATSDIGSAVGTDSTTTPSGVALRDELIAFVTAESATARANERLPGRSEILESALGRLKSLEGDHQKGGFTGLLLSLGALVGRLDATTISKALRTTPCKMVPQWLAKHFGQTLNSKRRETCTPTPRSAPNQR